MEITTSTPTKTIRVVDLDIHFRGETYPLTLRPEDQLTITDDEIRIVFGKSGEHVTIYRAHVLWMSRRDRELIVPDPADSAHPAPSAPSTPAPPQEPRHAPHQN